MKFVFLLVLAVLSVQAQPKLTLTREFPGSQPPHMMVELDPSGKGVYKEGVDSEWPIKFTLTPEEAKEVFDLAAKCDYFKRQLESGLKVAFMGNKIFKWEDGATKQEVKFNYTQDESGKLLQDWFEKITDSQQLYLRLERAVKYDKLGVHQALLYVQATDDRKRLVSQAQFLPLLDRVAKNDTYLHMARERAAQIADAIRARQPQTSPPAQAGNESNPPKGAQ